MGAQVCFSFVPPSSFGHCKTRADRSLRQYTSPSSATDTGLSLPQIGKRLKFEVGQYISTPYSMTRTRKKPHGELVVIFCLCLRTQCHSTQVTDLDEGAYGLDSNDPAYGIEIVKVNLKLKPSLGIGLEVRHHTVGREDMTIII
jgi:hypothetical protein